MKKENKKLGIKELLNKDVKEFNILILSLFCLSFLVLTGIISYKVNSSYAFFTNTINGDKTIEVTVSLSECNTSASNCVYSWSTSYVSLGASKDSISGYTTDYTTLGKNYFLKHNLTNDNTIESQEVCYLLNGSEYCLKGGSSNYYETNKTTLITSFGEDSCAVNSDYVDCSASDFGVIVYVSGSVSAYVDNEVCSVTYNSDAYCGDPER